MTIKAKKWQFQEAKNKFSEVVRKASEEGPQTVTKHGKDSVVVLSAEDYRNLEQPKTSLVEFFQKPPLSKVKMDTKRDKSSSRNRIAKPLHLLRLYGKMESSNHSLPTHPNC